MSKEAYVTSTLHQRYPTSKEAYTSVKRGLYECQKRPILVSKEAYASVKCAIMTWQVDTAAFMCDCMCRYEQMLVCVRVDMYRCLRACV